MNFPLQLCQIFVLFIARRVAVKKYIAAGFAAIALLQVAMTLVKKEIQYLHVNRTDSAAQAAEVSAGSSTASATSPSTSKSGLTNASKSANQTAGVMR